MESLQQYQEITRSEPSTSQLDDSNNENMGSMTSEQVYFYDLDHAGEKEMLDNSIEQFSEIGSESGVEPDGSEWIFDENAFDEFDITHEQALATLKYFCKYL
jgi:hypothetical protein